jgi:hypothetical protein
MGWTFEQGATRASLIEAIKGGREFGRKPKAVAARGNHLWCVFESSRRPGEYFILLCLLSAQRGYGWGYKDMDESMGPYYYTCPTSWFDKYQTTDAAALEWRETCRHQQRIAKMKPQAETVFVTRTGDKYTVVGAYCPRGEASPTQSVVRDSAGRVWRMKNSKILGYIHGAAGESKT